MFDRSTPPTIPLLRNHNQPSSHPQNLTFPSTPPPLKLKRPSLPPLIMSTTLFPNSAHKPPVEPYSASDLNSFAYLSATRRWPMILTQSIDKLVLQNNAILDQISSLDLSLSTCPPSHSQAPPLNILKSKLAEGKAIISSISELKYEAARDKVLKPLEAPHTASQDHQKMIELYNQELAKSKAAGKQTWFTASWLLTECYLYTRLHGFFARTVHWHSHDPFRDQKLASLRASWAAIAAHSLRLNSLHQRPPPEPQALRQEFAALVSASLWGNATDLSLRPDMSAADLVQLQATTRPPGALLRDDTERVWDAVVAPSGRSVGCRRVDFVLDNAGFELFTDLVLADWIVSNSEATVVFHPKSIPWFISDVMESDLDELLQSMIDPRTFFFSHDHDQKHPLTGEYGLDQDQDLEAVLQVVMETGRRWKEYLRVGVWKVVHSDCWTNPLPFWDLWYRNEPILEQLKASDLVIFKGDLNYRKLTGDAKWKSWTKFEEAIGPLDGLFNLLSLRTCKADVVVGLREGQEEDESLVTDKEWRINGKFGLITFCEKKINQQQQA